MKKVLFLASILVVSILAISFVMAFWPFNSGVTGNAIADQTPISDGAKCIDSDGGVFAPEAGYVLKYNTMKNAVYGDSCSGKLVYFIDANGKKVTGYSEINENYCDGNTRRVQKMNSTEGGLSAGYCVALTLTDEDGVKIKSARWAQLPSVCIDLGDGNAKDQTGAVFSKGCYGNNSKKFVSYSCNSEKTAIVAAEQDCSVRCDALKGCVGVCVTGTKQVTFDGEVKKDSCISSKAVRKYSCQDGGYLSVATENCGAGKECVEDTNGAGYCRDTIAGTATIASLQQQIADLIQQINLLTARIDALEAA